MFLTLILPFYSCLLSVLGCSLGRDISFLGEYFFDKRIYIFKLIILLRILFGTGTAFSRIRENHSYLLVTCRVVSRTPCRGVVDTSVGGVGCHLVVVLLAGAVRLAFHLFIVCCCVHSFYHLYCLFALYYLIVPSKELLSAGLT
jgi:hypothetical protein